MLGDKKLYPGQDKQLVKDNLKGYSVRTEEGTYERELSPEELEALKEDYMQKNHNLKKLNDDFKKIQDEFKEKIKLVQESLVKKLETHRTGTETCSGTLYLLDDQENGMMFYYSETGDLVQKRRLLPDERQTSIMQASRAAM